MADFFPEIDVTADEAETIARGLFLVARADGALHEREVALIAEFYASAAGYAAGLGALERLAPIDAPTLAAVLHSKQKQELFLKTAMLLAFADGNYGAAESKVINDLAKGLSTDEKDLRHWETQVKEFMLSQLTHIKNTEAVAEVSKELGVTR
jgi:tellurite resistance protein